MRYHEIPTYNPVRFADAMESLAVQERDAKEAARDLSEQADALAMSAFKHALTFPASGKMILPVPPAYWKRVMAQASLAAGRDGWQLDHPLTGLPLASVFDTALGTLRDTLLREDEWRMSLMGDPTMSFFGGLLISEVELEKLYRKRHELAPAAGVMPLWGNTPFVCRNLDSGLAAGWYVVYPDVERTYKPFRERRHTYVLHHADFDRAIAIATQLDNSGIRPERMKQHLAKSARRLYGAARDKALAALLPANVAQL